MKQLKPVCCTLCFLGLSICTAPTSAYAQNGTRIEINETAVYDDNPLMRSGGSTIDTIQGIESILRIRHIQETASRALQTTASIKRNQFNISGYNSTDFFLDLNYRKEIARWTLMFDGSLDYDTPRTANEITLGLVKLSDRRISFSISPSLAYKLSPRKSLGLTTSIVQNNYSQGSSLTDHRTQTISPFYSYSLNLRNTINAAYQYQRYEALSGADLNVDSTGPFLTWNHALTRNTALEASFGVLGTRYSGALQTQEWVINPVYTFEIEHSSKRNTATLRFNRARQALTNGTETDITTAQIRNKVIIDPRWALDIQTEYKKVKQSSFSSDNLDDSYSVYFDSKYDISRDLNLSISYKYAQESYITDRAKASRNVIRASLNYQLR